MSNRTLVPLASKSAPEKRSYYSTPVGYGFSVNSDHKGVAIQTIDGCSWWDWDRVTSISHAQYISGEPRNNA